MNTFDPTQRHPAEEFWVENYDWLAERGYLLRQRYHPQWTYNKKDPADCEDNFPIPIYQLYYIMDATRMSDGKMVMLKKITEPNKTEEASILHYFSAPPQTANPQNHTVPIIALLTLKHYENMQIVVMPFLRPFNSPPFDTVGEGVDFVRQALEAVQFLHIKLVAHRNCTSINFMMDPTELYPQGFHPLMQDKARNLESHRIVYTRTEKRPKYYLVNFSSARFYDSNERQHLDHPVYGTDRSVPEFQGEKFEQSHNPFATDVYYLGNMIKNEFVHGMKGFEYLVDFVDALTDPEPVARPNIHICVDWFAKLTSRLSNSHLGQRALPRNKQELFNWVNAIPHIFRRVKYVIKGVPVNLSKPLQRGIKESSRTIAWPETRRDGIPTTSYSVDGHINRIDNYEEAYRRPSLQLSRRWRKLSSRAKRRPTLNGSIFGPFRKTTSSSQDSEPESPTKFLTQPRDSLFQYRETKRHNSADDVTPALRRRTVSLPTKPELLIRPVYRRHPLKRTTDNISEPVMPQESLVEVVLLRPVSADTSIERDDAYDGISKIIEPGSDAGLKHGPVPGMTNESILKESHESSTRRTIQESILDIAPEFTRAEEYAKQKQESPSKPVNSHEKRSTVYQYTQWKYDCHICGKRGNDSTELIEHLVQRHKDYHTCTRCGSCYTTYEGLIKHLAKRGHTMILSHGETSDSHHSSSSNTKRHLVLTMRFEPTRRMEARHQKVEEI